MDIICINDNFESEKLIYFKKYGVIVPKKNKIYTIRKIINHTIGVKGLLLHEIINPKIPANIISIGDVLIEPTWNINRFSTLNGDKITKQEYVEMEK